MVNTPAKPQALIPSVLTVPGSSLASLAVEMRVVVTIVCNTVYEPQRLTRATKSLLAGAVRVSSSIHADDEITALERTCAALEIKIFANGLPVRSA